MKLIKLPIASIFFNPNNIRKLFIWEDPQVSTYYLRITYNDGSYDSYDLNTRDANSAISILEKFVEEFSN